MALISSFIFPSPPPFFFFFFFFFVVVVVVVVAIAPLRLRADLTTQRRGSACVRHRLVGKEGPGC